MNQQSLTQNQALPTAPRPIPSKNSGNKRRYVIFLLIVLILVAGGIYAYFRYKQPSSATYNYQAYSNHTVDGGGDNSALTFMAPSALKQIAKTNNQLNLGQNWISGNYQGLTYLIASSKTNDPALSSQDITNIDNALSSPAGDKYQTAAKPVIDFVQNGMIQGWKTQFGLAAKFTNPNIKQHAWIFNFSASPSTGPGYVEGQIVYALANANTYDMLVYSNSHNWRANTEVWQKIFNSIKIER